jgi:hypothetical protein
MAPSFLTLKLKGWPSEILGCWYPCCIDIGPSPFHTTVFLSVDWFEGTCCRKPWSHGYHRCKDHGFWSVDFPKPILILRYWSWGSTLRNPRLYAMIGSDLRLSCFNVWPPLADWAGAMKAWKRRRGDTRSAIQNGLATHTHNIIYIYTCKI